MTAKCKCSPAPRYRSPRRNSPHRAGTERSTSSCGIGILPMLSGRLIAQKRLP